MKLYRLWPAYWGGGCSVPGCTRSSARRPCLRLGCVSVRKRTAEESIMNTWRPRSHSPSAGDRPLPSERAD